MGQDATAKGIEAQLPDGHDGWILQDICPVEEEKDGPRHDHLAAVGAPTLVHPLHEDQLVERLAEKLLDRFLNVQLNQGAKAGVNTLGHAVRTEVFHRLAVTFSVFQRQSLRRLHLECEFPKNKKTYAT